MSRNRCFHLVRARSPKLANRLYPNLALPTIASVLKDRCEVEIHDLTACNPEVYIEQVRSTKPDHIGFTACIDDFGTVLSLAADCKSASPQSKVVVGGPHVSLLGTSIANLSKNIDFVVAGEGENSADALLQATAGQARGETHHPLFLNAGATYDLRSASFPAWELYDLTRFFPVLPIETSRGCSYACRYCGEGRMYGKKVRAKTIEQVVKEIKTDIEKTDVRYFRFTDSTLNFTKARFEALCRAFIDHKLDIFWTAYVRFDNMTPATLALAKEAGCVALFFGVESGSEQILKPMRKNRTDFAHTQRIVWAARDIGLHIHCNFMVGLPDETMQTVEETLQLIRDAPPHSVHISTFFVVPHTDVHINAERYGIRFFDPEWIHNLHRFFGDPSYSYFRHRTMTQDDMRAAYAIMRAEVEKMDEICWNLKDHLLLGWLSVGGTETELKRIWHHPEVYLSPDELAYFEAFKERGTREVDAKQNGNEVIRKLASRFR